MSNNFASHRVSLTDSNTTDIRTTTSNKQILVGCLVANTGSSAILIDVVLNDGSNNFYIVKEAPIPVGGSLELVSGKYVIPNGGKITAKSDNTSGNADVIVSTLEDVA